MKTCPKCNRQVKDTAKFCVHCGFNIKKYEEDNISAQHFCPECGTEITEGSFCPECGTSIAEHLCGDTSSTLLSGFDFSALESAAHQQLIEQIGLETEGGILVKYTGKSRTVEIPKGITEIYDGAFLNNNIISDVVIPEGVTVIGKNAFKGCAYLKSVTIPSTVKEIYEDAFNSCSELEEVILTCEIQQIRCGVFNYCHKLKKISLPSSITAINNSFNGCERLTEIYISDIAAWCNISGLNYLMNNKHGTNRIFLNNKPLTDISLPHHVTRISDWAFYNCADIRAVDIPSAVDYIGSFAFSGCKNITDIALPDSLTSIGASAFQGCGIAEITIPEGVKMGCSVLAGCESLEKATISSDTPAASSYGGSDSMFCGCKNLKTVIITNGVKSIGAHSFSGIGSLTQISIPDSVTSIGAYAFNGCSGLKSISIPPLVEAIGTSTFAGCSGLTSVTVPNTVNTIDAAAFFNCTSLESITLPFVGKSRTAVNHEGVLGFIFGYTTGTRPQSYTVDQYTQETSSWGSKTYTHYFYHIPEALRSVTVTDATQLASYAFQSCTNLTEINILSQIESIGSSAFAFCSGISKLKIPKTVTKIYDGAFSNCSKISSISIPEGVTYIGSSILCNCSKITKLYIPASVSSLGRGIANANITEIEVSPQNNVYKSMDGNLYSKDGTALYCYAPGKTDSTFRLPSSVKFIHSGAFSECPYLKNVYLTNNLEKIYSHAFSNCNALTSLTVPESVKSIGEEAFYYCRSLEITAPRKFGRYASCPYDESTIYLENGCRDWKSY